VQLGETASPERPVVYEILAGEHAAIR
jgi:hypothetical protein